MRTRERLATIRRAEEQTRPTHVFPLRRARFWRTNAPGGARLSQRAVLNDSDVWMTGHDSERRLTRPASAYRVIIP